MGTPIIEESSKELKPVSKKTEHLESVERAVSSENKYSSGGLPVCRLCGEVHGDMTSHIQESHGMTPKQYQEEYPGWPLEPREDSAFGSLGFRDRKLIDYSVNETFGFWWDKKGKKDKMVMGFEVPGPLTPKIDPNYVFDPEYTSVALLGLHLKDKVLTYGPTGCHELGTPILMHDGTIKKVEDVEVGDFLMGPDSEPRKVLDLRRGLQEMFQVIPVKGEPFVVNRDHILSLVRTSSVGEEGRQRGGKENHLERKRSGLAAGGQIVDVSVGEWVDSWSQTQKHLHKLFRVGVDFPQSPGDSLPVNPHILGLLLGDGCFRGSSPSICNSDAEIREAVFAYTENRGLKVSEYDDTMALVNPNGKNDHYNPLKEDLLSLGLWGLLSKDKFIPLQYKTGTRETRSAILAGLLDTDGHLTGPSTFDYVSASHQLAEDVAFVARSLGLAAYVSGTEKSCQTGAGGVYYRVSISGETTIFPLVVKRKQPQPRKQKKDVLRTGFTVEPLGYEGEYFGFILDGDHRYLMGDFTVTHNSGKTSLWEQIAARLNYNFVRINFDAGITRADLVGQWVVKGSEMVFAYGILPSAMVLPGTIVCFDEWDTVSEECSFVLQRPLEQHSQLLILEHGEQVITLHKHNLIVATANTAGMGDDTGLYSAGTRLQNFSQINRFSLTIEMNYLPADEEQKILMCRFPTLEEMEVEFMVQVTNSIRSSFMQGQIAAPLSTRDIINWAEKYCIWGDIRKSAKYCFINRMPLEDREVVHQLIHRAFE